MTDPARPYWAITRPTVPSPLQWPWGMSQHTIVSGTAGRYIPQQAAPIASMELQPRRDYPKTLRVGSWRPHAPNPFGTLRPGRDDSRDR